MRLYSSVSLRLLAAALFSLLLLPAVVSARTLAVASPNGGEIFTQGDVVSVLWSAGGTGWKTTDTIRLEYSTDSGASWQQIPGAEGVIYSVGSFDWNTTGFPVSEHYRIRTVYNGPKSVSDSSDGDFILLVAGTACGSDSVGGSTYGVIASASTQGNVFYCNADAWLTQIEQNAIINTPTELRFVVYEKPTADGVYTKIHENVLADSGTGSRLYSSGPIAAKLTHGRYYLISMGALVQVNFRAEQSSISKLTRFGRVVGTCAGSSYPPADPPDCQAASGAVYSQRLSSCPVPRSIEVTNPDGTTVYEPGDVCQITWRTPGTGWLSTDTLSIRYSSDGGANWTQIAGAENLAYNANSYSWNTTGCPLSDTYLVRISYNGDPSVSDVTDTQFRLALDLTPPTITHTPYPDSGSLAGPYYVGVGATDDHGIASVTIYWSKNGGQFSSAPMTGSPSGGWHYDIPGPSDIGDRYCYYIVVKDGSLSGNTASTPAGAPVETHCFTILPCGTDMIGGTSNYNTTNPGSQGTVFLCTNPGELKGIRRYMRTWASTELHFFVYESASLDGPYSQVHENTVAVSGPMTWFFSSGPISVPLRYGRYYIIGVGSPGTVRHYYGTTSGNPRFGEAKRYHQFEFPLPETTTTSSSSPFAVDRLDLDVCLVPRYLELLDPNGGERYPKGFEIDIQWGGGGPNWQPEDTVRLDYSTDGGSTWSPVSGAEDLPYDAGSFLWDTTELPDSENYRLRVSFNGDAGLADESDADFTIWTDTTSPAITHTPLTDTSLTGNRTVSATVTDDYGVSWVKLYYSKNGGSFTEVAMTKSTSTPDSYSAAIPVATGDVVQYYLEAADVAGPANVSRHPVEGYHSFEIYPRPDYLTQEFVPSKYLTGYFDLQNTKLTFTPDGTRSFYSACKTYVSSLPTDPTGGTVVSLPDDGFVRVTLADGAQISLFGNWRNGFYIGSDGIITLDVGDAGIAGSAHSHFQQKRITALGYSLDPAAGGTVSWKQTADRIAVTFQDVPSDYTPPRLSTFQTEMFFDGRIALSYLHVGADGYGLVGLSPGLGLPADFVSTDLSEYPLCSAAGVQVTDSIPAEDDLTMPYGSVNLGTIRSESVTVANTGGGGDLMVTGARLGQYLEDFSSGSAAGWQETSDADWSVVNGEYKLCSASPVLYATLMSTYTGATFRDLYYEVRVKGSAVSQSSAALLLRASPDFSLPPSAHGSAYTFGISGSGYFVLQKRAGSTITTLAIGSAGGAPYPSYPYSDWTTIGLSVAGSTLKCYINGRLAATVTDNAPLPAGRIGLMGSVSSIYNETYYFDDLFISQPLDWSDEGFSLTGLPTLPALIPSGQSLNIGVDYAPYIAGDSNAILAIYCKGGNQSAYKLVLSGTAPAATQIGEVKKLADGSQVELKGKRVSASLVGRLYIQDEDRSSGIGVLYEGSPIPVGSVVNVSGALTTVAGERLISNPTVTVTPTGPVPSALGVVNLNVGNRAGLDNTGLLVRTWGLVVTKVAGYIYVDDGSGLDDGTGNGPGVRVKCDSGVSVGQYVSATGIASCFDAGGGRIERQILARTPLDVVVLP